MGREQRRGWLADSHLTRIGLKQMFGISHIALSEDDACGSDILRHNLVVVDWFLVVESLFVCITCRDGHGNGKGD